MKFSRSALFPIAIAFLLGAGGIDRDAAASQAGGLPELSEQVHALQTLVASLQAIVTSLQSANADLASALATERAARMAADDALRVALALEGQQRSGADIALQGALAVETTNRVSADQHLQSEIDALPPIGAPDVFVGQGVVSPELNNSTPTVVASVQVPAGSYAIHAVVPVDNFDTDEQFGECALSTAQPKFNGTFPTNGGDALLLLDGGGFHTAQIPLTNTATFTQPAVISVLCTGFKWISLGATINAIAVGTVH
jgi:hypothetical protein